MRKYVNGQYIELTEEELSQMRQAREQEEKSYWQSISYDEAVDNEIRKRYSVSQEFAILRQRDEKPEEYKEYYEYCEECKNYVKQKQQK